MKQRGKQRVNGDKKWEPLIERLGAYTRGDEENSALEEEECSAQDVDLQAAAESFNSLARLLSMPKSAKTISDELEIKAVRLVSDLANTSSDAVAQIFCNTTGLAEGVVSCMMLDDEDEYVGLAAVSALAWRSRALLSSSSAVTNAIMAQAPGSIDDLVWLFYVEGDSTDPDPRDLESHNYDAANVLLLTALDHPSARATVEDTPGAASAMYRLLDNWMIDVTPEAKDLMKQWPALKPASKQPYEEEEEEEQGQTEDQDEQQQQQQVAQHQDEHKQKQQQQEHKQKQQQQQQAQLQNPEQQQQQAPQREPRAATAAAVHGTVTSLGPAALVLVKQELGCAPSQQQLHYWQLADCPFDAGELQQLVAHYLLPWQATRHVASATRSGRVQRESVVVTGVKRPRAEHHYPQLSPVLLRLHDMVQEQQQTAAVAAGPAAAGGGAVFPESPVAVQLLRALRCLRLWEQRQVQEQHMPDMLQRMAAGSGAAAGPGCDDVIEVLDLTGEDEEEQQQQLESFLAQQCDVVLVREVMQQGGTAAPTAAAGRVLVKQEPGAQEAQGGRIDKPSLAV